VRIRWLKRALADLDEAETFIAQENPSAASEVIARIVGAVTLLKEQPGIGRAGRVPGTKELVVPDTPYIVLYRVKDSIVQVLRVYHMFRKCPGRF
jgi:toxin ParE1/3/4